MHSGRARGVYKRGSEDVLLIEVAPGLLLASRSPKVGAAATVAGGT